MSSGFKRVNECRLCGKDGCQESTVKKNCGYCYRFGKLFFWRTDSNHKTNTKQADSKLSDKNRKSNNMTFDFGNNHYDQE